MSGYLTQDTLIKMENSMKNLKKLLLILTLATTGSAIHTNFITGLRSDIIKTVFGADHRYFVDHIYNPLSKKYNGKIPKKAMISALNSAISATKREHNSLSFWHPFKKEELDKRMAYLMSMLYHYNT